MGEPYLKSDVCLRPDLGGRDLKIRLFVYKIHTDQFFTLFSLVARQTLTYWLIDPDDALSSILTVKIITGAGTRENHRWRKFTKQATEDETEVSQRPTAWHTLPHPSVQRLTWAW